MSCEQTRLILHAYFDSEFDAVRAAEFEGHLQDCAECMAALETQKLLRDAIHRSGLYERAPVSLRRAVRSQFLAGRESITTARFSSWRWLSAAAAVAIVAVAAWFVMPVLRGPSQELTLASEIVDAHLRSLQAGHLTDVASTDQHTVKPWFDGKVDFAPPVRDFSDQGFPLLGGRLDVLGGRTVAALVYGRRKHYVSVFVQPTNEKDLAPKSGSLRGYAWSHWRKSSMDYWIVSDTSPADLEALRQLLAQ